MLLIKMIKSGLVQQNYGFRPYPSSYKKHGRWGTEYTERPYVASSQFDTGFEGIANSSYQESAIAVPSRPRSNAVYKVFQPLTIEPKVVNLPMFNQTTYDDIFGRKANELVDYVSQRIKNGEHFGRLGPQPESTTPEIKTETPLAGPQQPQPQPDEGQVIHTDPMSVFEPEPASEGVMTRIPVALGTMSSIVSNLSRLTGGPNYISLASHALLPQPVADYITTGHRIIMDNLQTLQRGLEDAVINPGVRMTSTLVFNTLNNLITGPNGVLGPGYTQGFMDLVLNTPINNFRDILQTSQENAIRTITGNQVAEITVSSFVRLWITLLVFSSMSVIAPRQARQLANRYIRGNGGALRDIPRISYRGMGG